MTPSRRTRPQEPLEATEQGTEAEQATQGRKREIKRYSVTIPIELPSANKLLRMHWAERKRLKDYLTLIIRANIRPERPHSPLTRARVTVAMIRKRRLIDADNIAFSGSKLVGDALQSAGIIVNDDIATIGQPEVHCFTLKEGKSKTAKTIVEIYELEEA